MKNNTHISNLKTKENVKIAFIIIIIINILNPQMLGVSMCNDVIFNWISLVCSVDSLQNNNSLN